MTIPSGFSGTHTLTLTGETSGVVEAFVINIGSGVSGLSATGVAILGIGVLAVVLLVGGGLLLYAGKRRKERTHA